MKARKVVLIAATLALAVSAWAGDDKKVEKRIVIMGSDGQKRVVAMGDGTKWEWKGDPGVELDGFKVDGVKRGFVGISMVPLTDDLRDYFGVADGVGVLVSEVVPDGPAAKAGLKGGDVIVAIDGKPVDGPNVFGDYVRQKKGGDQVRIDVRRKGIAQQFFVTLDERDVRRFEVRVPEVENWIQKNDDGTMKVFELDEAPAEALDRMRIFFESPEFQERVEKLRGDCSEYQQRLAEIETKMKELEKRLEKLK